VPSRFSRPANAHDEHGRPDVGRRSLWTASGRPAPRPGARPGNDRLGDSMPGTLGYARVSTGDQDVAGQTMRLTGAGAIRMFTDIRSGRNMDRPGLQDLLAYARHRDTLAVVRLNRLGRSLGELLTTVTMLKQRGSALLSLEEKIDTSSAAGELVFHVFGAIAHFERRLIAERTKDGIAAARAKGKRPGRQPLDADRIAAALKLVAAGLSPTAAAPARPGALDRLSRGQPRLHSARPVAEGQMTPATGPNTLVDSQPRRTSWTQIRRLGSDITGASQIGIRPR